MNKKNKSFIVLLIAIFTIGISYSVFSWSEPSGTMPTDYKISINASEENQDVDPDKPKVGNLDSDLLDGYDSSDLLAQTGTGYSCPDNYGNLCKEGGGLVFTYAGKTLHIDAYPRSSAWYASGSPTGQSLAWQMCQDIGARLPTLEEWQAACNALSGPNGNGTTTFGGGKSDRYEWTATPGASTWNYAVAAGGGSCSGVVENNVRYTSSGISAHWFRCVR